MDRLKTKQTLVSEKPLRYLEGFFVAKNKVAYVLKISYIAFVNKAVNNLKIK